MEYIAQASKRDNNSKLTLTERVVTARNYWTLSLVTYLVLTATL